MNAFQKLLDFLVRLDAAHLHYTLTHVRAETIAVEVVVPGERWEVEFMEHGGVEVERFTSDGTILDERALDQLLRNFSD